MATVTKKKLIHTISQKKGIHPNDVRNVIQAFLDTMTEYLSNGDRLEFRDFGVFEVVERKQKIGRNPKDAAVPIVIPARSAVKFTPGKKMRQQVEAILKGEGDEPLVNADTNTHTYRPY
ncbi:MAG: integration host factor subunit beta [Chlamydiales bacterium]|jgi:integration host factor subunit beta